MKTVTKNLNKKILPLLTILCLIVPIISGNAFAVEDEHTPFRPPEVRVPHKKEDGHAVHTKKSDDHSAAKHDTAHVVSEHGDAHHAAPPFIYYVNWALIVLALLISCVYCIYVFKRGKPKYEGRGLARFMVFLVIFLYASNQFPEVQRHFDAAVHQFVDGYHEPSTVGFIKFIYKMVLGIFLTAYGILGREEHH